METVETLQFFENTIFQKKNCGSAQSDIKSRVFLLSKIMLFPIRIYLKKGVEWGKLEANASKRNRKKSKYKHTESNYSSSQQ